GIVVGVDNNRSDLSHFPFRYGLPDGYYCRNCIRISGRLIPHIQSPVFEKGECGIDAGLATNRRVDFSFGNDAPLPVVVSSNQSLAIAQRLGLATCSRVDLLCMGIPAVESGASPSFRLYRQSYL